MMFYNFDSTFHLNCYANNTNLNSEKSTFDLKNKSKTHLVIPHFSTPLYSSPSFSKDVVKVKFWKWPSSFHAFLLCTKKMKKTSLWRSGVSWRSPPELLVSQIFYIFCSDCIATTSSFMQPNFQQIWLTVSVLHNHSREGRGAEHALFSCSRVRAFAMR